jgi:nicotinamidase-related amidase
MSPPVLLLIDFQRGFDAMAAKVPRNNLGAEGNARRLLEFWRERGWRVMHVRHDSRQPHSPFRPERIGNRAMDFAAEQPGEPVLRKSVHSAFIGTDLQQRLETLGRPPMVVCGITTDHCVSSTVRMGADLGLRMTLVEDACFTFDRTGPDGRMISAHDIHAAHIASLSGEFARVVAAAPLLSELARL